MIDNSSDGVAKIIRILYIIFCLVICCTLCSAQSEISFIESTALFTDDKIGSGSSKGFADVNGDFRDDVVRVKNGIQLVIDLQANNGEFFHTNLLDTLEGDSWAIAIADLDNDGINDIVSAGRYNGFTIFKNSADPNNVQKVFSSGLEDFFSQTINVTDVDNDGLPDLFICNDVGTNEIYLNKGNMNFERSQDFIDMNTVPISNNSGNYGSVFTDIDGDNDIDFYIAKCRSGVEDPLDPRRVNVMFINENGNFIERSEEWGVDIGAQSWTANFGDLDNDGDQDLFVANHKERSQLFENLNNNTFVEVSPSSLGGDTLVSDVFQSVMLDINNDGFLDLLMVGEGDHLLLNNGDMTFDKIIDPFSSERSYSFAVGDGNNDGFLDILTSYKPFAGLINSGSYDRYFMSQPNGNNYVSFSLVGRNSNSNGIGAKLQLFGDWGVQTRIVKSGQGYGVTHSLNQRFGLGESNKIDSLKIIWPSGVVQKIDSIEINSNNIIHEDECITPLINIHSTESQLSCIVSEIVMNINDTLVQGLWNTGEFTNSISKDKPGVFNVITEDLSGCQSYSQSIVVLEPEVLDVPVLEIVNDSIVSCKQEIVLSVRNGIDSLVWSNDEISEELIILETGNYYVTNHNECDTTYSESIYVELIDLGGFEDGDTIVLSENQSINLLIEKEEVIWFSDSLGIDTILVGQELVTNAISNDTSFYFSHIVDQVPPVYVGGVEIKKSLNDNIFRNLNNPGLNITADEDCYLHSLTLRSELAGRRVIEIIDTLNGFNSIHSKEVQIDTGFQRVVLDFFLPKGDYILTTNGDVNVTSFGSKNPHFYVLTEDLEYPYELSDFFKISGASNNKYIYPYYFDIEVYKEPSECRTEILEYPVRFNSLLSVNEFIEKEISMYPNPCSQFIRMESNQTINQIIIYNTLGFKVYESNSSFKKKDFNLSHLEAGYYIATLYFDNYKTSTPLLKQ